LRNVLKAIERIQAYVGDIPFEEFSRNDLLPAAVERKFIIIGEAVRHIPNEITASYPSIPWRQMADMRNMVAHVYWGVEPRNLWDTIHQDLPPIIPLLKQVLEETSE
jgi:uncharacterized protein with HEPN domain